MERSIEGTSKITTNNTRPMNKYIPEARNIQHNTPSKAITSKIIDLIFKDIFITNPFYYINKII
jgi:hypothetical protein